MDPQKAKARPRASPWKASSRIDVGAVKHCQAAIQAEIHQVTRCFDLSCAPGFKKLAFVAECSCAENQNWHTKA
jgi:hypothetical protein